MPAAPNRSRSFSPYAEFIKVAAPSNAAAAQTSFLDLLNDTPQPATTTTRQAPYVAATQKTPAPRRAQKVANGQEASLLNLLFDEPEMPSAAHLNKAVANDVLFNDVSVTPAPLPNQAHAMPRPHEQDKANLMAQIDSLDEQLRQTQAHFGAVGGDLLAGNQNSFAHDVQSEQLHSLTPLRTVERYWFQPYYWLYLGSLVGAALAVLFGLVFFPLSPLQGLETLTVRALFGASLGVLWAVLPFLLHQKQVRGGMAALEERDVYSSWQTRGQIIAE